MAEELEPHHAPRDSVLAPLEANPSASATHSTSATTTADAFFVRSWLLEKSENSRNAYARIAREYLTFTAPRTLRQTALSDLQNFLQVKSHHAKATQAQARAVLKSLYSFAVRTGYLTANLGAFLKSVRLESKLTERYLTEDEVRAMIRSAELPRDRALLRLLYAAGLRVSECVGLSWEDIQPRGEGALLKITGKGDKVRVVAIPSTTWEDLRALRTPEMRDGHAVFFPNYADSRRLSARQVVNIVKRAAFLAGIAKAVSPHWLRHAHASHALDRGAPIHLVQATLGHASIATTGKYLHARPDESSGSYLDSGSASE